MAALGGSSTLTLTVAGAPAPVVNCSADKGTVTLNGSAATFNAPTIPPANFATDPAAQRATITCTATNSAGSAQTQATVSLHFPIPTIASVTPNSFFCFFVCSRQITIIGTGFFVGGTISITGFGTVPITAATFSEIQLVIALNISTGTYSPGWIDISISTPAGPGAGTSNVVRTAFRGNQNTLTTSSTHAFQLDNDGARIHKFRLSDGMRETSWSVPKPSFHLAADETTGKVMTTSPGFIQITNDEGTFIGNVLTADSNFQGIAARDGQGCVSLPPTDSIGQFNLSTTDPPISSFGVGDAPWNAALGKLGNQLICGTFSIADTKFSAVRIPELQDLWPAITLTGLTSGPPALGWHVVILDSGPQAGLAALLHEDDKTLVVVNLNTGQEARRVNLSGAPFRIAADNTNGTIIVANADVAAGVTRFAKVNMTNGIVTTLNTTTNLLAVGFAVSSDGANLYCAMREQFVILPNN